jgi:hypothetical protein
MSTQPLHERIQPDSNDDDEPFRERDLSDLDLGGSVSRPLRESVGEFESGISGFAKKEAVVPDELRQEAAAERLRKEIKERYAGTGLVVVDITSGDIIATSDSMHDLIPELEASDVAPDERLLIRCHE